MNAYKLLSALFISSFYLFSCTSYEEIDTSVYLDPSRPVNERVEALLAQMTINEKIAQMDMVSEWDEDSILSVQSSIFSV